MGPVWDVYGLAHMGKTLKDKPIMDKPIRTRPQRTHVGPKYQAHMGKSVNISHWANKDTHIKDTCGAQIARPYRPSVRCTSGRQFTMCNHCYNEQMLNTSEQHNVKIHLANRIDETYFKYGDGSITTIHSTNSYLNCARFRLV